MQLQKTSQPRMPIKPRQVGVNSEVLREQSEREGDSLSDLSPTPAVRSSANGVMSRARWKRSV